ncbi:hypothetical protein CYMTET_43025 [Cymbomonas tetramitiformis]|uniref:Two-component response regulator n=1 Tax=Cymbomonas tetramitiformis TaxID=36881 RepID=A0AAE0F0E5_9CHLO|nr:hypothetical protein CYMTET_43025 [Cymbomonas tetramitiformis]
MKGGDSQDADNPPDFPAGLRILVVDDDPLCLKIVERMLTRCSYTVTVCIRAEEALAILRENREKIDIVLSDVYMPDMDGFKLLELIGLELDIPVIMMSANADTQVVLRGITHGAVDYLLKPVRIEELRNIWQHVVRRRHGYEAGQEDLEDEKDEDNGVAGEKGEDNTKDGDNAKVPDTSGAKKAANKRKRVAGEGDDKSLKKNEKGEGGDSEDFEGEEEEDEEEGESTTPKKPRVVWSVELHQQFVNAVNQLGIEKAVPKRILDLMGVSGLTRENVASHLQKYRLYLKRLSGVQQLQSSAHAAAAAAAAAAAGYPAAGGSVVTDASIGAPGLVTGVAAELMPPPNAVVGGVQMPYTKTQQNPQFGHFSGPSSQPVMYTSNTYVQQTYSNTYSGMPGNMMPPPNQQQQPQEQQPQRQRQMGMQQMGNLNDHTAGNSFAPQDADNPPDFPAGLRILVVDDDPLCLKIVERMLTRCSYTVTVCIRAEEALAILRENREKIDIVLSDVYMPDMDGFKLLELIGLELDIPVIMMSANADTQVVLRGITHGAVDYLLKPVRIEELRNIWQHVVRRRHGYEAGQEDLEDEKDEDNGVAGEKGEDNTKDGDNAKVPDTSGAKKAANKRKRVAGEGDDKSLKKNEKGEGGDSEDFEGEEEEDEEEGESTTPKKPRVVWSVELHQQFVNAVNQLGIEKAVPKRILDLMGVSGLTRENVASHLQKYRLYLKRLSGVQQLQSSAHAAAAAAAAAAAGYPAAGGSVVTDASIGAPGLVTGVAAELMPPPNAVVGGVQMPYTKTQQNPQFGHFSGPSSQPVMYTSNTYVQQTYSNTYSGMPGNMMPPPNQQQQPQEQQPQRQRQMGMQQMGNLNDHTAGNSFAPQGFNTDNRGMVYRNVGNPGLVQSLAQQEAAAAAIVTGNLPSMPPSGMQGMNSMQNMSYNSDMEQNRCSTSNVQQGNLGGMYRPQGDILRQLGRGLDDSVADTLEGKTLELEGSFGKPLQAKQYAEMEQFNNPMVKPGSQQQDDILSFFLKGNHFGSEPDLSELQSITHNEMYVLPHPQFRDQTERCKEAQEINAGLLARASESEKQHVAAQVQIAEANRQAMTEVASKFEQQFKHACEVLKDTQQSERQVSQANYEYQKQLTTELLQAGVLEAQKLFLAIQQPTTDDGLDDGSFPGPVQAGGRCRRGKQ